MHACLLHKAMHMNTVSLNKPLKGGKSLLAKAGSRRSDAAPGMPEGGAEGAASFPPQKTCTLQCPSIYLRLVLCASRTTPCGRTYCHVQMVDMLRTMQFAPRAAHRAGIDYARRQSSRGRSYLTMLA